MKYKVFPTKHDVLDYSEQTGIDAGIAYHAVAGVSRYMYGVIEHPETGEGACACPDGDKPARI